MTTDEYMGDMADAIDWLEEYCINDRVCVFPLITDYGLLLWQARVTNTRGKVLKTGEGSTLCEAVVSLRKRLQQRED